MMLLEKLIRNYNMGKQINKLIKVGLLLSVGKTGFYEHH